MITEKMVSDVDKKTKKEKKKNKRMMFFRSSRVDVMDSSTPDSGKSHNSSHKRRFPFLRRFFGNMLSFCWPGKSSSPEQKNRDTRTDSSSSPAVDRSSEEHPEVDLPAATQETEPVTSVVERIQLSPSFDGSYTSSFESYTSSDGSYSSSDGSYSSSDGSYSSSDGSYSSSDGSYSSSDGSYSSSDGSAIESEYLQQVIVESLGILPMGNTQTSGCVSTLFRQQAETEQDRATQGDDAGQDALGLPNLGNTCYMNSVLQCLLSVSPFQEDVLSQQENRKNEAALLRALSDLCMSRLGGSDSDLKEKLLAKVKGTIGSHYPDFKGNQQQDAHEFLMACLSCLKEESETLKTSWPTFTCPVANMEFKLKRERTCDSCDFQKSFTEDSNYLSLVIGPQACLTDSLQQCLNASSVDCVCRHCSGTKASETVKFLSFPQVLVLLVMRFDITSSSIRKLKGQLEIPEELTLSCVGGGSTSPHRHTVQTHWGCVAFGNRFASWTLHQSYP